VTSLDPATLTIVEAASRLREGTLTSVALTDACLDRIARDNRRLNAFITVTADAARVQAAEADRERMAGHDRGPLHGIPIAVKDLVDMAGLPTTAASRVRDGHVAGRDAPVIASLRRAGVVFVGKTNLHEFAMGTTNEESAYGPARHPLDETRSPGGSSGGSAIAVATGMALAALGSDTGGSIRIPSAACGLVGVKPAFGELAVEGVVPLSRSLDHVGPMARTVADAWLLYEAMTSGAVAVATGTAGSHAATAGRAGPDNASSDRGGLRTASLASVALARAAGGDPPRAAIPEPYFLDRLQPEVRASFEDAVTRLGAAGAVIDRVELRQARLTPAIYLAIVLAEAAAYHARTLEAMPHAYTPPVRLRFEAGRYVLAEDYLRALAGRERLRADVDAALASYDLLLLPTMPIVAPPLGATTVPMGDRDEPVRAAMLRLTQPFNLTGHPAVTVPMRPAPNGLPCGVQLVGRDTRALLQAALWCEGALLKDASKQGK
jgi:aspartyl-tRNA(Asn)/glutamyl-tRNA(Gln) amidotransferase subunit A